MLNELRTTLTTHNLEIGYRKSGSAGSLQKNLQIALRSGQLIALIGPNGSGKSTLLRTLAGFEHPLSGEVHLFGKPANHYSRNEWARLVSVVLTELPHADKLTVSDLVAAGRSPYTGFGGRLNGADRRKISDALKASGIIHLKNQYINQLSDGEKQRALIAKSLAQDTPVILLDEPAAFLDFPGRIRMMHLLKQLTRERQKSILITTHDINLALQHADQLWLVSQNKPLLAGIPELLALDGSLGTYFNGQQVDFDATTGKFLIDETPSTTVNLHATEPLAFWLTQALNRNQVSVTKATPTPYLIKATTLYESVELWNQNENRLVKHWDTATQFIEHLTIDLFSKP